MQVALIGKNVIYKLKLPQMPIGKYWISDKSGEKEIKIISVEGRNGVWQAVSNNAVKIINPNCLKIANNNIEIDNAVANTLERVNLVENSMQGVLINGISSPFILYCLPTYDEGFIHLTIKNNTTSFSIGNGIENDIQYKNILVPKTQAKITFNKGKWVIQNIDTKFGTFVNGTPVFKEERILLNGDVIFIMGLKIIIMGMGIYINNPLGRVTYNGSIFLPTKVRDSKSNILIGDESDIETYKKEEYYSRSPRIINQIKRENIKIDPPPAAQSKDEMPALLLLGSTITIGLVMVLSMSNSINYMSSSNGSKKGVIFQVLLSSIMLLSMVLFPMLTTKYEKNKKAKYEEKRQKKYKKYIDSKIVEINEIMKRQRNILYNNYPSAKQCLDIILSKNTRLWERKIENADFLNVRLGLGNIPSEIDIQYPEKQFTMDEDNLVDILNTVAKKSKILENVPITISLTKNNIIGLISKDEEGQKRFIKNLIMQLITFQSYADLKLVFFLKEDGKSKWDHLKMLPHTWNDSKDIRFFAYNYDEMNEISIYLEEELKNRTQYQSIDYKNNTPYYLIITDDYKRIENLKIITQILKLEENAGFSILCMADNLTQLPDQCKTFIDINGGVGRIFEREMTQDKPITFKYDPTEKLFFEKIPQVLSNIPIKYNLSGIVGLPEVYTFLQMYDVGSIEQLNIVERWNKNDPTLSLKAPIGVDSSGLPIMLDIHEKFDGPHGLVAGATGSGKSELLITYILSLAVNYHPDDVAFVLIDYKGGGLAGAFQKGNIKLPHLVGTITNIDKVGLQRSLDSIQSELRRRQVIFNEARNETDEGTIDIYKYQKLYHEGLVKTPIPHLLIICDEFAELKQQQEEFMDELISVARIGRSLGVHLILATQKPAGIVNGQIRSNSKFAICLKVQEREDSNDVIKRPDAAYLKNTGQFYIQVGNDEYFVLGQSAWSGAPYFPTESSKRKIDTSIDFLSDIGTIIKEVDDSAQKTENNQGEQLTNIVKYIYELAKNEKIHTQQLWLDSIPENIFIGDIRKKYKVENNEEIAPVIGEYDDPKNQYQGVVRLNLTNGGNTIIYGSADSGKETLLSTIVYDTITNYSSENIWLYLLDFGSEALKIFKGTPHVGDVVFMDDSEKISRFFDMMQNEIQERKRILSNYNGDYNLYNETNDEKMPTMAVIINNYEGFAEFYQDKYEDVISTLTREGTKFGITFILTVTNYNNVRYRLSQNFKQKIALQLNNDDEYYNIFDNVGKKRPSSMFGRGLIDIENQVYEFQTAKICEAESWNVQIEDTIEELKVENTVIAKPIPIMPAIVEMADIEYAFKNVTTLPIGIYKNNLKACTYNFMKNKVNLISTKNIDDVAQFIENIIDEFECISKFNVRLYDNEGIIQTKAQDFDENIGNNTINIVIGIEKFLNSLDDRESKFAKILSNIENNENCSFIIVDTVTRLKSHEYDEWYKAYISGDTGIWLGNGVDDQYLIRANTIGKKIINKCGKSYGYVIDQGEPNMIKLLGVREKGDDYE